MKRYKPTTPSRRKAEVIDYKKILTVSEPEKSLSVGRKRSVGRNNAGRITVRHKGGGVKRLWRMIDFKYNKENIPAKVESVEYDPNRSGFIGVVAYADGEKRYHLLPSSVKAGTKIVSSKTAANSVGNRKPLGLIPVGNYVYNIEIRPGDGAKLVRSAGSGAEVLAHDSGYTNLKMPSGEVRKISVNSWATIGRVSNEEWRFMTFGSAGRKRKLGVRPTVRGSAMNSVDHPFGGGEGRSGAGMSKTKNKWGKGFRGVKTRKKKKYSNSMIISRRKKKKK